MNRTIVALVEDKPGVLNRIASMFRRRGFNIASLAVGHSEKIGYSRMTFVVEGDEFLELQDEFMKRVELYYKMKSKN